MGFMQEVRTVVDPLFLKFREELMGSGVSYGRISPNSLPVTVIYTTNIENIVNTIVTGSGYIKGIKTYQSTVLKGVDQKELDFVGSGNSTVTVIASGVRSTITISSTGLSDPMTTAGDMIRRDGSNITNRLPIGNSLQVLMVSGGLPAWAGITEAQVPRQLAWYEENLSSGIAKGPLRRIDANSILRSCYFYVKTTPSGANLIIDVKKASTPDGSFTTIFTVLPQLTAGTFINSSDQFINALLSSGDILRLDVQQVGSITAGAGLTVDLNMVTR